MKDTSMRIKAERKIELERIAIDISFKTGKSVRYTDVINYLIDNYKKDAKEDMINQIEEPEQKKQDKFEGRIML